MLSSYSPGDFAAALIPIYQQLITTARAKAGCQLADAEDLVGEAVRLALLILPQFNPETGAEGLRAWLTRILTIVIMREHERAQRTVETVPIEAAAELPAPPPTVRPRYVANDAIRQLPSSQRYLVWSWLDGNNIKQIAADYNLHRHTVSARMNAAFHTLRAKVPIGDYHTFLTSDFDYCRRVPVYHKPVGVLPSWRHSHPPNSLQLKRQPLPGSLLSESGVKPMRRLSTRSIPSTSSTPSTRRAA
jgi:RNA polymerase sigma factor (sigma-70 family)